LTLTLAILLASAAVYSWKIFGYLVPQRLLEKPAVSRVAGLLTVALLAALLATQAMTSNSEIKFDGRIAALVVAAALLKLRAPFLVVVVAAAAVAGLLRALGF
jgi:uncharacterized membrane protein